jgi:hypothetical protein
VAKNKHMKIEEDTSDEDLPDHNDISDPAEDVQVDGGITTNSALASETSQKFNKSKRQIKRKRISQREDDIKRQAPDLDLSA